MEVKLAPEKLAQDFFTLFNSPPETGEGYAGGEDGKDEDDGGPPEAT